MTQDIKISRVFIHGKFFVEPNFDVIVLRVLKSSNLTVSTFIQPRVLEINVLKKCKFSIFSVVL